MLSRLNERRMLVANDRFFLVLMFEVELWEQRFYDSMHNENISWRWKEKKKNQRCNDKTSWFIKSFVLQHHRCLEGWSDSTPHNFSAANWIVPKYLNVPLFNPLTEIRLPIINRQSTHTWIRFVSELSMKFQAMAWVHRFKLEYQWTIDNIELIESKQEFAQSILNLKIRWKSWSAIIRIY